MHKPLQYFSDVNEKHPLVLPIIFFILGTIIASYGWLAGGVSFPVLIVSMLFLTFGILRKWRYNLIFICIIFFLLGAILSTQKTEPPLPNNHIRKVIENMAGVAIKEDNPFLLSASSGSGDTILYLSVLSSFSSAQYFPSRRQNPCFPIIT